MTAIRERQVEETRRLLIDRGYADAEFMHACDPADVLAACNSWAVRVGVLARGVAAVDIATSGRYPGLLDRLLAGIR